MKESKTLFLIPYIIVCLTLMNFSCNRANIPAIENHAMMITLKDNLSTKYISTNYQMYSPTDIKKSNKTLNQYEVNFSCNSAKYKKLQAELANDSNVTNFDNQNSTNANIQSGKNESHGKSKSIRNQN